MFKFLKSMFGSSRVKPEEIFDYNGFQIQPTPNNAGGGWSTEAIICKRVDGEMLTHHFIRADTTPDYQGAVHLTISKAQIMIDQAGDNIFSK